MALLPGADPTVLKDFFIPASHQACFPWESHALWIYTQMVFWRQTEHSPEHLEAARQTYRPDLYRAALAGVDPDAPRTGLKAERFFEGASSSLRTLRGGWPGKAVRAPVRGTSLYLRRDAQVLPDDEARVSEHGG